MPNAAPVDMAASAGLFLMAVGEAFNVYGAMNSSPWTAENFGADPEKARSCRRYVMKANIANIGLGVGASLVARNPWPLVGIIVITIYMHCQYEAALKKGAVAGTGGWAKP